LSKTTFQRFGDGYVQEMTEAELMKDIEEGAADAAERSGGTPLTDDERKHLFEIYASPRRFVSVEPGNEIILSHDGGSIKLTAGVSGGAGHGLDIGRRLCTELYERVLGSDTMDFAHVDYSFKPIKNIMADEQQDLEQTLLSTILPIYYGAMPNLGSFTQPDGPFPNPTELMTQGKIKEAQESCEQIVEMAKDEIVYIASGMYEAGADGVNMDTTGALGDADFLAALQASEILRKKYPGIFIEMGMAGEFILGIHGGLTYDGVRLAGLWPHQQVKLAAKAGVTAFGPVVNTNTKRSCAWNVARLCTMMKSCVAESEIPVHPNMGMGVGGSPLTDIIASDAVSRGSTAVTEINRIDGL
jgi:dimethylamine--corrinoid protein Co-methyltransferase